MPQITLTRSQVQSLVSFCEAAKSDSFFIAKDHGAYVGFSTGPAPEHQCICYFKGCILIRTQTSTRTPAMHLVATTSANTCR